MSSDDRLSAYVRLLRWYPATWRDAHQAAVVGILLDRADARGERRPRMADRLTLAVAGVAAHFRPTGRRHAGVILPLALASAFALFYFSVIAWAPGISYPGTVGPFTNPSVIVAPLLIAALLLAVFRRESVARRFAIAAAVIEVGISLLSSTFGWLGPSMPTAVLVGGLATAAALPWRGRVATTVSLLALGALVALLTTAEMLRGYMPESGGWLPAVEVAVLVAVVLSISIAARRARRIEAGIG